MTVMLQQESIAHTGSNTLVKTLRVFKVLHKRKVRTASVGDFVMVSSRKVTGQAKKGEKYLALVVNTRSWVRRPKYAESIRFSRNVVLLVSKTKREYSVSGTRINVALPREVLSLLDKNSRSMTSVIV